MSDYQNGDKASYAINQKYFAKIKLKSETTA